MSISQLLTNVHISCCENNSAAPACNIYSVQGNYEYYHYLCDGFDDRGWGCGYRTLQTICSWMKYNCNKNVSVPSIREIQTILVEMGDKPEAFVGSRQWIGSFEVCLVIDKLYDVPCKILHVSKGDELKTITETLKNHFVKFGSPVMMGGDLDCSSKGIMGIQISGDVASLLVVDPHYVGRNYNRKVLHNKGWVKWQPMEDFLSSSFYNLCLPQIRTKNEA